MDESTNDFFLKSKTPCKAQSTEVAEKLTEEFKISPLLANNPWITMTRGSSSKKLRKSESTAPVHDIQSSPLLKQRSRLDDKPDETVSSCDQMEQQVLPDPVRIFKILLHLILILINFDQIH